jgi:hypothetical protein
MGGTRKWARKRIALSTGPPVIHSLSVIAALFVIHSATVIPTQEAIQLFDSMEL